MGPGAAQPRRRKLASPSKFVYILVTYTRLNTGLMPNCQSPGSSARTPGPRPRAAAPAPLATPPAGPTPTRIPAPRSQLRPRSRRLARTPAGEGVLQRPIRRGGGQQGVGVGIAVLGTLAPPFIWCDGHVAQVRSKASLPSPRNPSRLDEGSRQLRKRRRLGCGGASRGGDGTL